MEIKLATQFSKEHFEAMTLREEVLGSTTNLDKEKNLAVYVAMENGKVIGTAAVQLYPFSFARVRQVAVSPDHQGKQIGSSLLDKCEAFAKNKDHSRVILTGRTTASLFYLKRDYRALLFPFKKHEIDFMWMGKNVNETIYSA